MFCKNCGKEIDNNADVCIHCGVATEKKAVDNPSHLTGAVSCCFPVVGLILYFLWKDEKPQSASLICKWMIGGTVAWVILYVLCFVVGFIGNL